MPWTSGDTGGSLGKTRRRKPTWGGTEAYSLRSKSECIRFVHSRGSLRLVFSSAARDRIGDFGRIIYPGQLVQPRAVLGQVSLHITDHIASALPCVVARTLVVHIAEGPLNRVRTGTIRR
jgi:hypothetical protein